MSRSCWRPVCPWTSFTAYVPVLSGGRYRWIVLSARVSGVTPARVYRMQQAAISPIRTAVTPVPRVMVTRLVAAPSSAVMQSCSGGKSAILRIPTAPRGRCARMTAAPVWTRDHSPGAAKRTVEINVTPPWDAEGGTRASFPRSHGTIRPTVTAPTELSNRGAVTGTSNWANTVMTAIQRAATDALIPAR